MRWISALFVIEALAGLAPAAAAAQRAPQVPAEARRAAAAMVARFTESWNQADSAAYGANYWPDAELVDPLGIIGRDRAAIVREHVELWAGIFKGSHVTATVRRVRMLGPDFMMVDFDASLAGVQHPPPGSPVDSAGVLHNHLKHIMERRQGVWKVLAAQNTFVVPRQSQ